MLGKLVNAFRREDKAATGTDGSGDTALTGAGLSRAPAALPPQRAHHHGHGHTHHHGHRHGHAAPAAEAGTNGHSLPARSVFARAPQTQKEVDVKLSPALAVNEENQPAQAVTVRCDKHENWAPVPLSKFPDGGWHGKIPVPESTVRIHYFFEIDGSKRVIDPGANRVQIDGQYVGMKETRH